MYISLVRMQERLGRNRQQQKKASVPESTSKKRKQLKRAKGRRAKKSKIGVYTNWNVYGIIGWVIMYIV